MTIFDILGPILMIAVAIAVVALAYLVLTACKDRMARKREEESKEAHRARRR